MHLLKQQETNNNKATARKTWHKSLFFYLSIFVLLSTIYTSGYSQHRSIVKKQSPGQVKYKTVTLDGLQIFYRESGPAHAPVILLLHGFPSSSYMYRDLINDLSDSYHVIAPDYPGFGLSSSPSPSQFSYTFDHLAAIMLRFVDTLGIKKLSLYMQDYGGPIGFRIASERPSLIQTLIIQNANAYMEGLGPEVQKIGKMEKAGDHTGVEKAIDYLISLEGIREQYLYGAEDSGSVNPDSYMMDHFLMERPGNREIQHVLFHNYSTNFPKYPDWQNYFRNSQPPALIIWGKNDQIFIVPGARAYTRDLKDTELHLLNGSHFALEEHHLVIAGLIDSFLKKKLK